MKNSIIVGATIAIIASTGFAAPAEVAVNWTAAAGGGLYSVPGNWSIGQAPINTKLNLYNVTINTTGTVTMDVDTPVSVQDLILGASQTLKISRGHSFKVMDDAQINGIIDVQNSSFIADQPGAAFGLSNNARLVATGGGLIRVAATVYASTGMNSATLFSANGAGTLIDLSTVQMLNAGFNDGLNWSSVQTVAASAGATVDLSGLQTLVAPVEGNDRFDLTMSSAGFIDLSGLQQIYSAGSGWTRLSIMLPAYELPSLLSLSRVELLPASGCNLSLPLLEIADRMTLTIPTGSAVSMPSVVSVTNSTVSVATSGSLSAPNLLDFRGNSMTISSGQTLVFPGFQNIDNSRFIVQGGAHFSAPVTGYSTLGYATGATILSSSGVGSLLELASVQVLNAGFNDNWNGSSVQSVVASAGGRIDLSGVQSVIAPVEGNDRIDFNMSASGLIDLAELQEIYSGGSGWTRFTVSLPSYELPSLRSISRVEFLPAPSCELSLPALEIADRAAFTIPTGATVSMPQVASITNATLSVAAGGTLSAPELVDFRGNAITFAAGQVLAFPGFQNIDNSRFTVQGGTHFSAPVVAYSTTGYAASAVLLSASGPNSTITLAALRDIDAGFNDNWNGASVQTVSAATGGLIDLTSVRSIRTPSEVSDRVDVVAADGGTVLLSSLAQVTSAGSGQLRVTVSGTGSYVDVGNFGKFDRAAQLTQTGGSQLVLGPLWVLGSGSVAFNDDATGYPSVTLRGSFRNESVTEANVKTDDVILTMESRYALFETASTDQGVAGLTGQNFQVGRFLFDPPPVGEQLVDAPAMIVFVDNFDNGNRGGPTGHESVYFTGLNGTSGIIALHGGTLVLNGLHVYTYKNGQWIDLQQGLPAVGAIPFLDGFIANRLEDTIGDFNGSRCVDGEDLGRLLGAWGTADAVCDINGSGLVDGADLGLLLGRWGCD
ncbi:MAG: hypothetical protein U0625_12520 [Phycisphaerales bacterium]